jgi:uncharacterized protein YecE (DUF72 family)
MTQNEINRGFPALKQMRSKIRIGTSGYSYPDWKGPFYPVSLPHQEMLSYYATHFRCLEMNFTYYRMPTKTQFEKMIQQTAGEVEFSVKAYSEFTHGNADPGTLKDFLQLLTPLQEAGVLGCVLFQFPFKFKFSQTNLDRISALAENMGSIPGIVEFRHAGWINDSVFKRLAQLNLTFCCVDQPDLPGLPGCVSAVTSSIAYIRFHGRNRQSWWQHTHSWERYHYMYGKEELSSWLPILNTMLPNIDKVYLFFNNHYQGQAIKNAQMMGVFLDE